MKLALAYDWKRIARRAWSFRLTALAFVFSGAEVVVPLFVDAMPRGLFAVLSFSAAAGGLWARLVTQNGYYNHNK